MTIGETPPLCACGCGQLVGKRGTRKAWNKYVHGHHVRVKGKNPGFRKDKEPWNKGNETRYEHTCSECGKAFQSKFKERTFCSRACMAKANSGENSLFYKHGNGRTKYRFLWINGKAVREHRLVMAEHLGRELKPKEVVHHIDEDGLNNALDNLHLFHCEKCHQHHHRTSAPLEYIYGDAH